MLVPYLTVVVALLATGVYAMNAPGGYSTYLGGPAADYGTENAFGIAVDAAGNAYVGGATESEPFPATRRYGEGNNGGFVVKISPNGAERVYSTFLNGISIIAVKLADGNELFALGHIGRDSQTFVNLGLHGGGYTDAVLLKLDAQGVLIWGRYFGGNDLEVPRSLALDSEGNAYITGFTTSTNLPASTGSAQPAHGGGFDGFVAKISSAGSILFATYIGDESSENALAIAVDSEQRAIVAGTAFSGLPGTQIGTGGGTDAFVLRLNASGSAIDWVTKIGGGGRDSAIATAIDADGTIVLLGSTASVDFPVTGLAVQTNLLGSADLFLARLSDGGEQLLAATFFGSNDGEDLGDPFYFEFTLNGVNEQRSLFPENAGLAIGSAGAIHIASRINSENWPAVSAFPLGYGGSRDPYFARINSAMTELLDFRFLGGSSDDEARAIALDSAGNSYLAGTVYAPSLPPFFVTTTNAIQTEYAGGAMDPMVVKIPAGPIIGSSDSFATRRPLIGTRTSASALISDFAWFTWRAPASGRVIASTAGSTFDPLLVAFTGASETLIPLATNETRLVVPVIAGTDYHFSVSGAGGTPGIARLSLAVSQPANDDFANAIALIGFPVLAEGSNVLSTAESGEPAHDDHIPARSVWWSWSAPDNRSVAVSTEGSSFDTVVAIYSGDQLDSLTRIASHDNISNELRASEAVFLPEAGKNYYIVVDGPPDHHGLIKLRVVSNEPPSNDSFASRSNLTGVAQQVTASNLRATMEPAEPRLAFTNALNEVDSAFSGATVWWSWTAPRDGRARIDTLGSDFDTRLGVYTGTNLALAAAHDDINRQLDQRTSVVEFDAMAGREYFIQVDGSTGRPAGIIKLNLKLTFPPKILPLTLERQAGENWRFQAEGVPGANYRVEISEDLQTWLPVTAASGEANGIWQFTISTSNPTRLFIRLASIE